MAKPLRRTDRTSSTNASSRPRRAEGEREGEFHPAYKSARAIAVFLAAAIVGVAADLLSKHYVFSSLIDSPSRSADVIDGLLKFTLSTNPGIVFGIPASGWVVLAATLAATVAVVVLFGMSPKRQWGLHTALAMVLAGAAGNAYDRLFSRVNFPGESAPRLGHVRDFIDVHVIGYPVFNVADILLVVGVALILLETVRRRRQ